MNILLFEDNPGDARLIHEMLRETGDDSNINIAERLGQGLEYLLWHDVDVILLDMNLPDSRGLDTLTGLFSRFPHLPVVVMTSISDEGLAVQSVRLGAQDYLIKGKVNGELLRRALIYAIERQKLDDTLRRQASMLDMSHDAIFCWELGGGIRYWNAGSRGLYGFDRTEAIGKNPQLLLKTCGTDAGRLDEILEHDGNWEGELTHTTQHGKRIIVESRMVVINQPRQKPLVLETNHNITERKRAEEALRKSRDELELRVQERTAAIETYLRKLQESNQALQDFASISSHDMQEPLRKVISFGKMLKQSYADSLGNEGNDYLERMLNATERMQTLLKSLRDYSRVTTQAEPFRQVDLGTIVHEVLSDLEVRIEKTGGEVHVSALPTVEADPIQMRQLFQNLIGNALKFHRENEKPFIEVRGTSIGNGITEIVVADNGIGFDEKYQDRIFAPFQRLHGRSAYEGTGMGLAICKKIVDRHNGTITARSIPGRGSVFTVTLPSKQKIFNEPIRTDLSTQSSKDV